MPVGPVTFTSMSRKSINIQIDKGNDLGSYQLFTIQRENGDTVCDVPIYGALTDCLDSHARQGKNHYRIGAKSKTATSVINSYYAKTLEQDRK